MMNSSLHVPVLEREVIRAFCDQPRQPLRFFEGTFGRGGHTKALLDKFPKVCIVGFDKDQEAVKYAEEEYSDYIKANRLKVIHDDFRNLEKHSLGLFDGALFDLGVSSPQFDDAQRGFSFSHDGPLDMRMNLNQTLTAQDTVNQLSEKELSDLFFNWGEVRRPNRVVRAIVHDRKEKPFTTTLQLAGLIARVDGRRGRNHPATNYFMALRIYVNRELVGLTEFFESMPAQLERGSRMVVISFHSLEDRIIKNVFRKLDKRDGKIINKKVIMASDDEVSANARARSAKMRIFEKGGV